MLTLKDWPTARQWIQVVAVAVLTALASYNMIANSTVEAVAALIAAVLPPALSVFHSPSTLRSWFYGAVAAVQTLLIVLNVATEAQITPVVNIVLAVLAGGVAVTHTPTPLAAGPAGGDAARLLSAA
ncbi:hypothetical protein LV457_02995 [Mycobacterium sp. MYCO198283]|uniref:phage holin n=1 Tax=Mycobacterium sp. MYCO198283 TaxID=2883505 RepID=UPI001E60C642|nr:hypothetical protein [Mycobacterium sp. MYCO198283]MCG5431256.1 hypothetical protein [Mycobacterium sp. MYCO198283]